MHLFLENRILEIEKTEEFLNYKEKTVKRQIATKKAVETKTLYILNKISKLNIDLPNIKYEELLEQAIVNYNEIKPIYSVYANQNSEKNFLDRICVNYLRHNCINLKEQTGDECYKFFISLIFYIILLSL